MSGLSLAADAAPLILALAALALLLFLLATWFGRWSLWVTGYFAVVAALAVAFFFRDPARTGERSPALFLAPADGRVVSAERVAEAEYVEGDAVRVAIYLGLLDVHVQRSPVDGVVEYVQHRPGRFAPAWSERVAENESTSIGISTGQVRVLVRQVAGTVARRIVTYVDEGELVDQGERVGLIRFGSRVEVYLPGDAEVVVEEGDRVLAGTTVLARLPRPETP